jgi:hypothetical protein
MFRLPSHDIFTGSEQQRAELFPLLAWLDANPGGIATRGSDDGSAPGHDEAPMCRGLGCFLVSDGGFEPLTSSV